MIRLTTITALIACMATPVLADVTAADIWNGFKSFNQATGLKVDATQSQSGNITTISDLKFSGTFPYDLGAITITSTGFDLVENSDGTVTIEMPDHMPIAVALTLPDDLFVTANLDYQITGYSARASGDADNYTVTYDIEKSVIHLDDMTIPGDSDFEINMSMTVENMAGSTTYMPRDMLTLLQKGSIGKMAIEGQYTIKGIGDDDMASTMSMLMEGMESSSKAVLPAQGIDLMNLSDQLRNGLALQFASQVKSVATKEHVTMGGELFSEQKTFAQGTNTAFVFSKDGLMLDSHYSNYALDFAMQMLPFPIRVNFDKIGGVIRLPLLKSDAEQDFSYAFTLDGMTMDDALWSRFDPDGGLPRDPASMTMDFNGKGRLFMDLLDFEAISEAVEEGHKIAEPTSLTINAMDLAAIGAKLAASGMFTFDTDDYETYDGIPAPSGTATLHFAGLNGVIDTLMDIGLIGDEEALGIRMGLGLFTVIGERKDTLISEIEITPDGHISANGKRLK